MKLWERKRVGTVIRAIYEAFQPKENGKFHKKRIAVRTVTIPGSKVTVLRARRYLGVEHRMIAGVHCWLAPKRTLQEALNRAKRSSTSSIYQTRKSYQQRIEEIGETYSSTLQDIMKELHFDASVKQVAEEMETYTGKRFNRTTLSIIRRKTGCIQTVRIDKEWRWVMRDDSIKQWLKQKLVEPMEQKELFRLAMEEKQWGPRVLNQYRADGFSVYREVEQWFWRDLNSYGRMDQNQGSESEGQ